MKIMIIGDFRRDIPQYMICHARMFSKGFMRCGHDVMEWSYRESILGKSWLNSKKWAMRQGKPKADANLLEMAGHYQPDVVMIIEYRLLRSDVILKLKQMLPESMFVMWYGDLYSDETNPQVNELARHCDWFMATSGGRVLEKYKRENKVARAAFIPQMCDPDLHYPHEVAEKWRSNMLFTGKLAHGSLGKFEQDDARPELVKYFIEKKKMAMYGDMGYPPVWGRDYLDAIAGTKIGLNINVFNDVSKYYSNRLINYLSNGAFVLSAKVPDAELMFEDGRHLVYFECQEDCKEKADYYLVHDKERKAIAEAGTKHAHDEFNCTKISGYVLDLIEKGSYDPKWGEII